MAWSSGSCMQPREGAAEVSLPDTCLINDTGDAMMIIDAECSWYLPDRCIAMMLMMKMCKHILSCVLVIQFCKKDLQILSGTFGIVNLGQDTVQCHCKLSGHNDCHEFKFSTVWNFNNFTQVHKLSYIFVMISKVTVISESIWSPTLGKNHFGLCPV